MYLIAFFTFWVKYYKNKPLTILEVRKETLGFILKIRKKITRWCHNQKISIESMKTEISPLFLHFWSQLGYQKKQKTSRNSNLLVWSATFQPKLNKLWKTVKKVFIFVYFYGFSRVFQSRMKSSGSYQNLCSLLLLTPLLKMRYGEIVAEMNFEPKFDLWKSNLDWASQSVSGLKLQKFRALIPPQG